METFKTKARTLFCSMGPISQYNLAGRISGHTLWEYPTVIGFTQDDRNTVLYRARQLGHLIDTAALLLQDWVSTTKTCIGPNLGDLQASMATIDESDLIQTSESTVRFITDESRRGSKCVLIIAMYSKLAPLSTKDKGPVAYFLSGDKYCIGLSVAEDPAWKGVKYLLEDRDVCKVFLDASKDLPNLMLASQVLNPSNLYCLKTQHRRLEKLLHLPVLPGNLPQFHRLYGVKNIRIEASGEKRLSHQQVLQYCHQTKAVLRLWLSLMNDSEDAKHVFDDGYKWSPQMVKLFLQGHSSIFPSKAIVAAASLIQKGHDLLISLLAAAHVILTFPEKDHTERIKEYYDEIHNIVSVMTNAAAPLPTDNANMHHGFIHETANLLVKRQLPCETFHVGSLGDIVRRMRIVMPNFVRENSLLNI